MAVPTAFPVLMQKPGAPDMQVSDLLSYNNALAQGYTFGITTPSVVIETGGGQTVTVSDDPLSTAQTDPGQQDQVP